MKKYNEILDSFKKLISEVEYYNYITNTVVYWDKLMSMPKNAIEYRSKIMGFLADKQYQCFTSQEFSNYMKYFDGNPQNTNLTNAMIENFKLNSQAIKDIPEEEYDRYICLIAKSEQIWEEAREKNDYILFLPYLKEIMQSFRNFAEYWGYEKEPYDALLNFYVEDFNTEKVDALLAPLKNSLLKMLRKTELNKIKKIPNLGKISKEKQLKIWELLLKEIGFDFTAGRLDAGSHTTILANYPKDVRIINSFEEDDIRVGIFNVLHSGGRGIYQQKIDASLIGTMLADPPSCAIKEAIGRFYENMIGKNYAFWKRIFPSLVSIIPEIAEIGLDSFYIWINQVQPTPIRISADEVTFLLHIIIRYEIERALINEEIQEEEAADLWKKKYKEYLNIEILRDSEGILQDIHWAAGYIGYFPTYILSNFTAAQFVAALETEMGDLSSLLERGGMKKVNDWLEKNVYKWGAIYSSYDLIESVSGEEVNPEYYIQYLRNKFSIL